MKKHFRKSPLALALCASIISFASQANTLVGTVTDAQGRTVLQGAEVRIQDTGYTTTSNRQGRFRLNALPEGEYTLLVSYLGAKTARIKVRVRQGEVVTQDVRLGQNDMDNLVVRGQRGGQADAMNRQKNALGIKSIVSSDAIGQLPDQNAAEALQRLPGLFISRDQGEGRFVGIRGIDPNLNNVTINGASIPSPEAGVRSVAMDVIPSELIESLEVSKTVTPDMDASAVGGAIEVKSLSAFDRQGQSYTLTLQGSHNQQVDKTSPKLSGSYTNIWSVGGAELGVASALSWFERDFGSHNMEIDGGWDHLELTDTQGNEVSLYGAEEIEQRHYLITRERLGAALNLDLRTSDLSQYYLRTLYSEFADDEYRLRKEYKLDKGELVTGGRDSASYQNAEMDRDTKDRYEQQEILSVVLGGENPIDNWLLEYQLGYSKSSEKEPNRLDMDFTGDDFSLGYRAIGQTPTMTQDAASQDLTRFTLDEVVTENNLSEDKSLSVKLDVTRDFVWQEANASVKFGVKLSDREKFNRADTRVYDGGFDEISAADFALAGPSYHLGEFGPGLSRGGLREYVNAHHASFELDAINSQIDSLGQSYRSEEDIRAVYVMLTLDWNKWQLVTGFRFEDTHYTTLGNKVSLIEDQVTESKSVEIQPWSVDKDYHHLMPNLNLKYQISDTVLARFAYTQTLARPTFSDAAAFQLIEVQRTEEDGQRVTQREAEVGNPELDPYESNNLDLSLEYYPGGLGVLSLGVFYKDIDNFIVQNEVQALPQWQGFEEVRQAVNGGSAELKGIELAWNKQFDAGWMIGANTTVIDADDKLPNQADTLANLSLGYENHVLSTRLSASYRSESYQFEQGDMAVYQDAHAQLDFSLRYYWGQQTQVYFNLINLTDEPMYLYHGSDEYNLQYEEYGRSFELGITFTSL